MSEGNGFGPAPEDAAAAEAALGLGFPFPFTARAENRICGNPGSSLAWVAVEAIAGDGRANTG